MVNWMVWSFLDKATLVIWCFLTATDRTSWRIQHNIIRAYICIVHVLLCYMYNILTLDSPWISRVANLSPVCYSLIIRVCAKRGKEGNLWIMETTRTEESMSSILVVGWYQRGTPLEPLDLLSVLNWTGRYQFIRVLFVYSKFTLWNSIRCMYCGWYYIHIIWCCYLSIGDTDFLSFLCSAWNGKSNPVVLL